MCTCERLRKCNSRTQLLLGSNLNQSLDGITSKISDALCILLIDFTGLYCIAKKAKTIRFKYQLVTKIEMLIYFLHCNTIFFLNQSSCVDKWLLHKRQLSSSVWETRTLHIYNIYLYIYIYILDLHLSLQLNNPVGLYLATHSLTHSPG